MLKVASTQPYGSDPRDGRRVIGRATALAAIGAGLIHVAAATDHADIPPMMVGFEIVAVLQVGLGALLLWRLPSRALLGAGAALMACAVALWLASRTVGLGFIEGAHAEPVGFRDSVTVALELVAVAGLATLLRSRGRAIASALADVPLGGVAALVLALAIPASLTGGHGHPGEFAGDHAIARDGAHGAGSAGAAHAAGPAAAHRGGGRDGGRGHGHGSGSAHARHHRGARTGGGHAPDSGGSHAGHAGALVVAHGHGAGGATVPAAHTIAGHGGATGTAPGGEHGSGGGGSHGSGGAGSQGPGGGGGHNPAPGGGGHYPGHDGHDPAPAEPPPEPPVTDQLTAPLDPLLP